MIKNRNFFTSGWIFAEDELDLKGRFQMMNIAFTLSSLGLLFGIFSNIYKSEFLYIPYEVGALIINAILLFTLRFDKKTFRVVSFIESFLFWLLFMFFIYTSDIDSLRFLWIFAYPIVLLYFQSEKHAKYWLTSFMLCIFIAPFQPFIEIHFTTFQIIYMLVVLLIITSIVYFYQFKMKEAKCLIFAQKEELKVKVEELTDKDNLLTLQSKQAVMGEMISMIAHQWRQPLSSVTLVISDLQLKKMLGGEIDSKTIDITLQSISDTVVYLSDTIDDFQTYFKPNKKISTIKINDLVQKTLNFIEPRLHGSNISVDFNSIDSEIETYSNELIQVILNILNNAVDELLGIEKKDLKIVLSLEEKEKEILLHIKDNAQGILEEKLETIFEPYYSTKGKNGTGLGLYMSQMIMQKQFNSKIEVSSSKEGSVFTLFIPKKLL